VWGGPTVFLWFSAGFGQVMWHTAELTSVAKCMLQFGMVEATLTVAEW
jgi:hypothetical protein